MFIRNIHDIINATQETTALYVLALLCVAMILDILTGVLAAKVTGVIESNTGINGIMRKASSIIVLIFCAFLVPLIPYKAGIAVLYVLYLAYLGFELTSIVENLKKMGVWTKPLESFKNEIIKEKDDGDA